MYFFISSTSQSAKEINMKYMNSFCSQNCIKGIIDGKLQCNCGEDIGIVNWCWSKTNSSSNTRISNNSKDILFHPLYSSGTAAVRGDVPFQANLHYYWEIKMISNLYGTDVMVGVGTSKIVLSDWKFRFCSMLGIDSQSWGYSYHGNIQHNKLVRKYGSQFGLGSIVGVHLDMCNGTLEYYVNRKPLGIAFKGLKGRELYPMVSSTAAQSAVRITCAVSEEPTLQMRCLEFISKRPELYKRYKEIPGLTRLYERKYFWIVPTDDEEEKKRLAELEDDLMCPLNYKNFLKRSKKLRAIRWIPPEILHVREENSNLSDSDLEAKASFDDSSILPASQEDSTSSSSSSSTTQGSSVEDVPSTSKQGCDEFRKIRRTDPFRSDGDCSLRDNKKSRQLHDAGWVPPEMFEGPEDDSTLSDSDLDLKTSLDDSSTSNASQEDSTSSSLNSTQGPPEDDVPSTSKQGCDESRNKIRRTNSFSSHSDCALHDSKKFCAKCKFRMQIEDENMSDSSGS